MEILTAGSGLWKGIIYPFLTRKSALSLAGIPSCPDTHTSCALLQPLSFIRDWKQSHTSLDPNLLESSVGRQLGYQRKHKHVYVV
jgi:hypothetical protein